MLRIITAVLIALAMALPAAAQSTAINGTIEGTITDEQGAVLPGVTVTVTNVDTGDTRAVVTNESGLYRAPLLPLGTYRVEAELQGFKKYERSGVTLRAGQVAVIDFELSVGTLQETITVTADAPLVDLGKIEQGRTLSDREIKTLPLTSRNPYNFALLQPGVVGFETRSSACRASRQRRAAARELPDRRQQQHAEGSRGPAADADVRSDDPRGQGRHHRLRAGVRPDDGPDLQRDHAVGHQHVRGQASYRMQRQSFAARPFFTPPRPRSRPRMSISSRSISAAPSCATRRTSSAATSTRSATCRAWAVITISPANQAALGLSEPAYMPRGAEHGVRHRQGRSPDQPANRLSVRYIFFDNFITEQRGRRAHLVAARHRLQRPAALHGAQLISTMGAQPAERAARPVRDARAGPHAGCEAGTGPAINITGVANFGGPIAGAATPASASRRTCCRSTTAPTSCAATTLSSSGSTPERVRHPHGGPRRSTRSPSPLRTRRREERRQPVRLLESSPSTSASRPGVLVEPVRLLRAGRLAGDASPEGALRRALRPVRRAGRRGQRADCEASRTSPRTATTSRRAWAWCGRWANRATRWSARTPASCTTRR
jgi:hypothetical protein